jgi:hypothetical protein
MALILIVLVHSTLVRILVWPAICMRLRYTSIVSDPVPGIPKSVFSYGDFLRRDFPTLVMFKTGAVVIICDRQHMNFRKIYFQFRVGHG